jgi:hypothetical protein
VKTPEPLTDTEISEIILLVAAGLGYLLRDSPSDEHRLKIMGKIARFHEDLLPKLLALMPPDHERN